MLTMIIGGAGSGKSQYGEELLQNCGCERKIYIATMLPTGEESQQRILRHRAQRVGKVFETIECFTSLAKLRLPAGCGALLECVGNLAANELYSPQGAGKMAAEAITTGVENLWRQAKEVIAVSYTHLDVYKRQDHHHPHAPGGGAMPSGGRSGSLRKTCGYGVQRGRWGLSLIHI